MLNIFRLFSFAFLAVFAVSCIHIDDDDFFDGGSSYNDGQVTFDGLTIPLTYADFYRTATVQGGEIWSIELSENFLGNTTYSDAYLYLEIFRPYGASLEGTFDMHHPVRFIDYAAYYEDVYLVNGIPNSYGFHIPNNSFVDGRVRIQSYPANLYYFEVRLHTYTGEVLTAWFEGKLRY